MSHLKSLSITQKLYVVCSGWITLVGIIAAVGIQGAASLSAASNRLLQDVGPNGQRLAKSEAASIHSSASTHEVLLVILGIWALVGGSILTLLIARGLRRNAAQVLEWIVRIRTLGADRLRGGLDALAEGDLTVTFPLVTGSITDFPGDELGTILREIELARAALAGTFVAYNRAAESLRTLVGEVGASASRVAATSSQMAATSEQTGRAVGEIASAIGEIAAGAERQVRSVESVRATTELTAAAARNSADHAEQATGVATRAEDIARGGIEAAQQAADAIDAVSASTQSVTEAIHELASKSQQIGGIVETITGLADQTNLLALNAAIEAARAGEQGRGFAVVAEEVRKLADGSQQAAREIGGLIGEIQAETQRAVAIVEDGSERTRHGSGVFAHTREAFERLAAAVQDLAAQINSMAAAAHQIADGSEHAQEDVNEVAAVAEQSSAATQEVSASTEQTSASTEEVAAAAEQLAAAATDLSRLVDSFRITAS